MLAPAVFAFGLVAFGFLGMGPVTIAVDSYGPVTDNAQSVFELSVIEGIPGHPAGAEEGLRPQRAVRARRRTLLEENDGAGNTFKATAKPVLIGTAVVGATTMIFSIIVELTRRADRESSTSCRCSTRRSCSGWSPAARSSTGSPVRRRRRSRPAPTARSSSSRRTSSSTGVRRRRSRTARRSSRSARSTRRRGCSTSS